MQVDKAANKAANNSCCLLFVSTPDLNHAKYLSPPPLLSVYCSDSSKSTTELMPDNTFPVPTPVLTTILPLLFISHRPFLAGAWRFISICSRYPWQSSIPVVCPSIFVFLYSYSAFSPFSCCTVTPLLDMAFDDLHIFTWT